MGEEKPDEELMGKRKSSPRLSPTPLGAGNIIVAREEEIIRSRGKKLAFLLRQRFAEFGAFAAREFVVTLHR